jgi:hypothetical protein
MSIIPMTEAGHGTGSLAPAHLSMGRVVLTVNDLNRVRSFYEKAVGLADPEGNGVEIDADRPASSWKWKDGAVTMPSDPLDVYDLLAAAGDGKWLGFPGAGNAPPIFARHVIIFSTKPFCRSSFFHPIAAWQVSTERATRRCSTRRAAKAFAQKSPDLPGLTALGFVLAFY